MGDFSHLSECRQVVKGILSVIEPESELYYSVILRIFLLPAFADRKSEFNVHKIQMLGNIAVIFVGACQLSAALRGKLRTCFFFNFSTFCTVCTASFLYNLEEVPRFSACPDRFPLL